MWQFINLGIFDFIVELAKLDSAWLYVGFLSFAFFSGVVSGLLMMVTYQATAMNKFMGIALKPDNPLMGLLGQLNGGNDSMGDGNPNQLSGLISMVAGSLGVTPPDKTDSLGLPKKRNRRKTDRKEH